MATMTAPGNTLREECDGITWQWLRDEYEALDRRRRELKIKEELLKRYEFVKRHTPTSRQFG